MPAEDRHQVIALREQMEEMWGHLNDLFERLSGASSDGVSWDHPHGDDWTLADVPYHLAYCNHDIVVKGVELGSDYPEAERELLTSAEELHAWNEHKFAQRPPDQTPAGSVTQWRASCTAIRSQLVELTDADLDQKAWMPLMMGWATARHLLMFGLTHDWSEFTQLRIHMGLSEPKPSPVITRAYLGSIMRFFPMRLNREAAAERSFKAVMAFTDPGIDAWTIEVADGAAAIQPGAAEDPDLVLTQSSETFEKTLRGIQDPADAIQAGDVQVSDFDALAIFGALFPA